MSEENKEMTIRDIEDEATYFQYQKQEYEKLMDAESKAYEDLKELISNQRAEKGQEDEDKESGKKIEEYLRLHNDGKKNNEYLVRGAELQCTGGTHTRKLNLSPCHGVYVKGHPLVHELDCLPGDGENITWFGICNKEGLETESIIITRDDGEKVHGLKCHPEIVGIWIDSYDGTKIVDNGNKMEDDAENPVGCNTLTVGSFLVCKHGGIISPVNSGQHREVKVAEFEEGQEAFDRVMDFKCNEHPSMEEGCEDLAHEMLSNVESDGMTGVYREIKELASQWDIDYNSVKWKNTDAIYWKGLGGDQFIHGKKLEFISQYRDVIKDAAERYDLPEELVAGVVYCEYGGDPMFIDDVAYSVRAFDWCGPEWVDDNLTITRNPDLTSFGNVSIQVRRAWESLGYRRSEVSDSIKQDIINSLKNPVENIYISAKHISDLRDIQYPDMSAEEFTDEEILVVATRYNRGPDLSLEAIKQDTSYGARIISNQEAIKEALQNE